MVQSMNDPCDMRPNEEAVALEPASDATLRFIGTIRTPWRDRKDCPRQGNTEGPGLVQFGDFTANGLDQSRPEQHQANSQTQGAHHHHPHRYARRHDNRISRKGIIDRRQRTNGIGNIIGIGLERL